jgi:Mn-dependent DtxR family transcriptional regulator
MMFLKQCYKIQLFFYLSLHTYLVVNKGKVKSMDEKNNFNTFNEYMKKQENILTASMEDYLEMLYRLSKKTGFIRVHELSEALNVQPPSATKMVQRLAKLGYIKYEKYGFITLEEMGKTAGEVLIKRHNTIENLLRILGIAEKNLLMETEKVEHTLSEETIENINLFIEFASGNPDVVLRYQAYRDLKKAGKKAQALKASKNGKK